MKRLFLMFLLTAGLCEAWPGRTLQDLDFVGNLIRPSAAGGPSFYPTTGVANVGLFLSYRDLGLGAVKSWTNEMPSGDVWTNGLGLKQPTNTGMGLYFYNGILTNNTFSNVANYSIWIVIAMGNDPTNYAQIIGALAPGTTNIQFTNISSASVAIGAYYGARSSQAAPLMEFTGHTGDGGSFSAGAIAQTNMWNDIMDAEGNLYWDGVAEGTFPTPTGNINQQAIGNNSLAAGSPFLGYIKYILISTNHQFTATERTNLWIWDQTNGVTNVSGSLVSWWKFNDSESGTALADSVGGWNGVFEASPTWTAGLNGVVNQSLTFNDTDAVFCPITSGYFPAPGQGCTISAWVKYTSGGNASSFIMGYANVVQWVSGENVGGGLTAAQGFQLLQDGDANIRGEVNSTVGNETEGNTMAANDGNWHHMVFASDGTNVSSWFDGTRNDIGTLNGTQIGGVQSGTGWLTLMTNIQFSGPSVSTNWEPCTMTDVRIYNRLLNDAEVDILYRAPTVDAIIGAYTY